MSSLERQDRFWNTGLKVCVTITQQLQLINDEIKVCTQSRCFFDFFNNAEKTLLFGFFSAETKFMADQKSSINKEFLGHLVP